tara:strand:+ start:6607 stop:6894 length:288 start_codon:yes stop_codon:yes gene_type:complete
MIAGAPELKNKVNISWYLLVAIVVLSITIGGTVTKVLDNDIQRLEMKAAMNKRMDDNKIFLLDEVNGLRSDWDRQYNQDINKRLDRLEKKIEQMK